MKNDLMHFASGAEAAKKMLEDPEAVVFPLSEFVTQFGLAFEEWRVEAAAGRLVVSGRPTATGMDNIGVTAKALIDWMVHPDTPPHLVQKVKDAVDGRGLIQ